MAIAPISKIHIIAHDSVRENLIDHLLLSGVIQPEDISEKEQPAEEETSSETILRIEYILKFLGRFAPKGRPGSAPTH